MMRICKTCNKNKPFGCFDKCKKTKCGYRSKCKECRKDYRIRNKEKIKQKDKKYRELNKNKIKDKNKQYYIKNKSAILDRNKKYREYNKDKIIEIQKEYYINNRDELLNKNKEYRKINKDKMKRYNKKYVKENYVKILEYKRRWYKEQSKYNIQFRIKRNLRKRIRSIMIGKIRGGSAVRDLGCNIEFFMVYMEKMFYRNKKTGENMRWDNYGYNGWHIDHIKPLAMFDLTNHEQFLDACHYTNLQPLWAEDNLKKGSRY